MSSQSRSTSSFQRMTPVPPTFFHQQLGPWNYGLQVSTVPVIVYVPIPIWVPPHEPKSQAVFKDFSKYEGQLPMAWRFQVDWMNECHHCGSPYHFGRSCLAELGCSYEECNKPYGHCITVCYVLHGRCTKCRKRGHRAERCGSKTEAEWRAVFQKYWPLGLCTQQCGGDMRHPWGFFYPNIRHADVLAEDDGNNLPQLK